jgi:hypothetical protein
LPFSVSLSARCFQDYFQDSAMELGERGGYEREEELWRMMMDL